MKKKQVILILLGIIFVTLLWYCSLDPNVESINITDVEKYMEVNKTTAKLIDEYSAVVMPSQDRISADSSTYQYVYECALFGDPNCVIFLSHTYDEDNFFAELKRINSIFALSYDLNSNRVLYSMRADLKENVDLYTDDIVNDGKVFVFEFIIVDESNCSIEYLFAVQHDGHYPSDSILDSIIERKNTEAGLNVVCGSKPLKMIKEKRCVR